MITSARNIKVKGLTKVVKNLQKAIDHIEGGTLKGMIEAVALIRNKVDTEAPVVPVDFGNLRASWFTTTKGSKAEGIKPSEAGQARFIVNTRTVDPKTGKSRTLSPKVVQRLKQGHSEALSVAREFIAPYKPAIAFGFSAYYALLVHEDMETPRNRPNSGPKFLESKLKSNHNKIINIIRENAKVS